MEAKNKIIELVLTQYKVELGVHYAKYRNHVYRVFTLCLKLDQDQKNITQYAIASVFHDIGIWTHNSLDYLQPSIELAKAYLLHSDKETLVDEITLMIDMHHKRTKYKGLHQKTVETLRRADWIDVSKGWINFGLHQTEIMEVKKNYPNLGFHSFLALQILKQFLKSPLNPLPMFKK